MPKKRAHILIDWVKEHIQLGQLPVGQRLPTEAELSAQHGLSRNAVRNALSQLAQQDWLRYEKNRGYFVSKNTERSDSAAQQNSTAAAGFQNIGLLCFFPGHYIFPEIITGFSSTMNSQRYNIIIKQSEYQIEQERLALQNFLQQNVAGLVAEPIFDGTQAPNLDLYQQLAERNIPIIFVDTSVSQLRSSSILCHDLQSGREAAQNLLALGYQDFILFYQKNYLAKTKRIQGVKEVLQQRGKAFQELGFLGQGQHSDVRQKCETFFQSLAASKPMAWICSNDEEAAIVIEVAKGFGWELHRDYELIAFDNSQLSQLLDGGFSSFTHPGRLMGRMASRYLQDQLAENPLERHCTQMLVESNLIRRNLFDCKTLQKKQGTNF